MPCGNGTGATGSLSDQAVMLDKLPHAPQLPIAIGVYTTGIPSGRALVFTIVYAVW